MIHFKISDALTQIYSLFVMFPWSNHTIWTTIELLSSDVFQQYSKSMFITVHNLHGGLCLCVRLKYYLTQNKGGELCVFIRVYCDMIITFACSFSGGNIPIPCSHREQQPSSVIDDDGDVAAVPFHPGRVYVVLEENVVTKDFRCWPNALVCLYGLMYSLQHGYPNCMKNTFGFIQKVLLNFDGKRMKPKVLVLKNQL